ncbi:glycosyltransferase family A protein [Gorillibacterium sp. CAU 1737]|uniref:glycosyltransferase family 2 protein n=1 Tax=Gorillibacterium sp. CAU 1737 TaxID=3140362 RepID=UPI0032605DD7
MTQPSVSILVPVQNNRHEAGLFLEQLKARTPEPHDVLVLDLGSVDGTAEEARTRGVPFLRFPAGAFTEEAVGRGLRLAAGDLVAVLDVRHRLRSNWVPTARALFEAEERLAAVELERDQEEPGRESDQAPAALWLLPVVYRREALRAIGCLRHRMAEAEALPLSQALVRWKEAGYRVRGMGAKS